MRILDSRTYTTGNAIDESGTLVVDNDATMTVGGLTIEPTGTVFVGADSALNVGSPILSFGTLINAGSITAGAGTAVAFGTNTNRLILGPTRAVQRNGCRRRRQFDPGTLQQCRSGHSACIARHQLRQLRLCGDRRRRQLDGQHIQHRRWTDDQCH
ncbi:MAG: hypothetical protein U1E70_18045 [Acetobacteraceae bacterium]